MFSNGDDVPDNQCIGVYAPDATNNLNAACPTIFANAFSAEDQFALGPVPAGGATVSNLFAVADATPAVATTHTVEVIIVSPIPSLVLSCTVTSAGPTCSNTGSSSVAAGNYLGVRIQNDGAGVTTKAWRVSFRY